MVDFGEIYQMNGMPCTPVFSVDAIGITIKQTPRDEPMVGGGPFDSRCLGQLGSRQELGSRARELVLSVPLPLQRDRRLLGLSLPLGAGLGHGFQLVPTLLANGISELKGRQTLPGPVRHHLLVQGPEIGHVPSNFLPAHSRRSATFGIHTLLWSPL